MKVFYQIYIQILARHLTKAHTKIGRLWDSGECLRQIAEWLGDKEQRVQLNGHRSGWMEVRSRVSQGSALGPLLFNIFIDDIDEQVLREISKFAGDTKITSRVNTLNDIRSMQRTLEKLVTSSNNWEMEFSINKCGIMHIGKRI